MSCVDTHSSVLPAGGYGSSVLRETASLLDELRVVYGGHDESTRMTAIKARREQMELEARKRGRGQTKKLNKERLTLFMTTTT